MKDPVFVENWPRTRERWQAFWAGDYIDRPILQLATPRKNRRRDEALERDHQNPRKRHGDYRHIAAYQQYIMANTRYFAEALPVMTPGSSVGTALYFGCDAVYDLDTMWCEPLPVGADGLPHPVFQRNNAWYCWFREASRHFAQESRGRYYTLPNFGNHSADVLALIRGTENFMMDLIDRPEWVAEVDAQITDRLLDIYLERFLDVEQCGTEGYLNEAYMWSPERSWGIHCDISYMTSTEIFRELLWPSQKRIADMADYAYYHVDGIGVLRHLDVILNEPRIGAIQWLPGDGRNHPMDWLEVYSRIQQRGRSLQIFAPYDEVLPLLPHIKPGGVCIMVLDCPGEDEAEALVEAVEQFYKG